MDQAVLQPIALPRKSMLRIWLPRVAILLLIAVAGFFVARMGLHFRRWTWDTTVSIRFVPDINRGYMYGRACITEGYLNQYERMQNEQPDDMDWMDYGPLRLGVMARWGKWSLDHFPNQKNWYRARPADSYDLTAPVLRFNLFMEVVGLVSAFFLTRLWAIRGIPSPPADRDSIRYFFRGCAPGFVAVLLLWFNPAIVLSAYGWPTWDLWIVPIFLLAALLASADWWFTAGVVIGIGAMFKGQQLLAVPVFAIWSLMVFRPLNTLKFLGGVTIAIAVVTSGWLLTYIPPDALAHARELQNQYGQPFEVRRGTFAIARTLDLPAVFWVIGILAGVCVLPFVSWIRCKDLATKSSWRRMIASPWVFQLIAAFTSFALFVWPWLLERNRPDWEIGFRLACLLAGAVLMIRPRGIAYLAATATGIAMLLCMSVFHGSHAWYDCGLAYGRIHWPKMITGMTDNLPGIMVGDFDWPLQDITPVAVTIKVHLIMNYPAVATDISIKLLLQSIFVFTFVLSCLGVGMHARRRDGRVLIALVTPWLMFFCFPAQIHERYLLFAAGISCVCAGVSTGMTLLGVFLSMVTFIMTLHTMLIDASEQQRIQLGHNLATQFPSLFNNGSGEKLLSLANGTHPDLGYAVLLCGMIFLYFSLAPRRRNIIRVHPASPAVSHHAGYEECPPGCPPRSTESGTV